MKRRKVRILASALALALTVSMSGCTVSINMENKKETETTGTAETKEETTKEETTEKETKKANEETKKVDPTATPTPEPTATPAPQKVEQTAPVASQQTTAQNQYVTYYVVNCKQSITLRPQPDVNSGEITQIPLGSAVSYVGAAENGFYKVIYNGNTGYALASYLSTTKPSETAAATSGQINTANY